MNLPPVHNELVTCTPFPLPAHWTFQHLLLTSPNQWGVQHWKSVVASLIISCGPCIGPMRLETELSPSFITFIKQSWTLILQKIEAIGLHHHILKEVQSYVPHSKVLKSCCWWWIVSSLTSAVWSTTRLSAGTLANPHLHQGCCQLAFLHWYLQYPICWWHVVCYECILQRMLPTLSRTIVLGLIMTHLNPFKYKHMRESRKRKPMDIPAIFLEGTSIPLESVDTLKYLWCHLISRPLSGWICLHQSKETVRLSYRHF